jgi:chromosome segregation ATPase
MALLLVSLVLLKGTGTSAMAQSSVSVGPLIDQIRQIDSKIAVLQSELAALESQFDQTSRDSASIVSASVAQLTQMQSRIAQADKSISLKKNELAEVKAQRKDLERDSLQKVTSFSGERAVLKDKMRQIELSVTAAENELNVLKQRRVQLQQFSQQVSDPVQASILQEKNRYDSIVVVKQELLNGMHLQLKQMESDSMSQSASLQAMRAKNEQDLQQFNSELAQADSRVMSAKTALDQVKARLAEKKGAVNSTIQQLISRKASLASQVSQASSRLKGYETELNRLRVSAGALQKKYEAGRAPIAAQLNEATATLDTREQQKQIWVLIREKFVVDSMISAARNELDELIQQSASGKRGAKKLIDPKEAELNELLGKQDTYVHTPGVKQMDAQLASMTMSQKRIRIEQVLSNIITDISKQTSSRMQAEQALANYDANNPISSDPSLKRMRSLDTLLAAEQQKKSMLSSEIDSADYLVKVYKDSVAAIDAAAYNEIGSFDSEYRNATAQRTEITARRDQLAKSQKNEYAVNSSSIATTIDRMGGLRQKINTLQMEIQNAQSRSADAQNRLLAAQQKFEQGRTVASNEAGVIGNTIMAKELTIKDLTSNLQQLKSQQVLLESNFQNEIAALRNSVAAVEQVLVIKNGELQQISNQRNSLQFEYDNEIKKQQSAIVSLRSASSGNSSRRNSIQSEIVSLQGKRSSQLMIIKNQVAGLSGTISRTSQDIENVNASYNTALQDSINFESTRENAFLTTKRSVTHQDSMLTAIRAQIQAASVEYEKGRADSAAALSMKEYAVAPHIKKIRQLDSLIILKERELSSLKGKRMQAVQDSITGAQGADAAIMSSAAALRKKQERIASLEVQYAVQEKEKKRIESEAASKGEQYKSLRQIFASKINAQLSRLSDYQSRAAQLNTELQAAEEALAAAEGRTSSVQKESPSKSTIKSGKDAQVVIEKIYTLMGENRMADAKKLFDSNVSQLKKFASPDAVKMLESSF